MAMQVKIWLKEIRASFLILPIIMSSLGSSLAFLEGYFDSIKFLIFTSALILMHITVNTLNELDDYRTGIDWHTRKTPFSGGSGILQAGLLTPEEVRKATLVCFLVGLALCIYLLIDIGLILLPIIIPGIVFTLLYTRVFARSFMGEVTAGLGLGFLPVLGAYVVQTSRITEASLYLSIAPGLFVFNLLLLNEFPDLEADRAGGRRNLVIALGPRKAAWLFSLLTVVAFAVIVGGGIAGIIPPLSMLCMVALPFALRAISGSFNNPGDLETFVTGMLSNVQMILLTGIFGTIGIAISVMI